MLSLALAGFVTRSCAPFQEASMTQTATPRTTDDAEATGITPATASPSSTASSSTKVALVVTEDRDSGVRQALDMLEIPSFEGKSVLLKPNFNSSDPTPGSTHPITLQRLASYLQARGAYRIIIGDRSGMGDTRAVMETLGVFELAESLGLEVVVFDDLLQEQWKKVDLPGGHWKDGFALPRILDEVDSVVQTCCLKTHRYGGHFTMSLKNSVGLVAKQIPGSRHDYMRELHLSRNQREMIAEINHFYRPDLILMDGIHAFTDGGPAKGTLVASHVILAGVDRVAVDALGVAVLRKFGTTREVEKGAVFSQAQIARAVELGVGIHSPDLIDIVTADAQSSAFADELRSLLRS
jgi:uncharacterized protein (DUF362 family)